MLVNMELELPRDARYVGLLRTLTGRVLDGCSTPSEAVDDVRLAITEACSNAVRHATGGAGYTIGLSIDDTGCEILVSDLGPGFEPPVAGQPAEADDDLQQESGRGLRVMRAVVDDLVIIRDGEGAQVRMSKSWERDDVE